jgi:phosphoserine aminotransferase
MTVKLADAGVAYDIGGYRTAPPGLRVWGGPTVEAEDMAALMPWLDWAFGEVRAEQKK